MAGPIRISVLADGGQARRELDSVSRTSSKMGQTLAKVGRLAATGLAVGVGAAAVAAAKFATAAAEDQQAAALMAKTFENAAGATKSQIAATEDWITAQGKALGVADDDLRPALSRLVTATHDVGEAQKLASLAMDVSAGSGKSLEQVSTALMKAQNGQVSSLSRLGINTKNAAGETITMAEATRRMSETFGGAAAAKAGTLQGKLDRLKLALSEAGESIGYKILPPLLTFAEFVQNRVVPAAERMASTIGDALAPYVDKLRDGLATLVEKLTPVGEWFRAHPEIVKGIGIAFGVAAAAAGVLAVALGAVALVTSPITLTVVAIAALGAAIAYAWKNSETFRTGVTAVGDALKAGLGAALDWVTAKWNEFGPMILDSLQAVTTAVKGFVGFMLPFWKTSFETLFNVAKAVFNTVKGVIEGQLKIIQGVINVVMGLIKGDWDRVWEGIKQILSGVWKVIESVVSGAINAVKAVLSGTLANIRDLWSAAWDAVKTTVSNKWDGIKTQVSNGIDDVVGFVKGLPGRITSAVSGAFDGLKNAFRSAINFIIDGWNNLSFSIPGFDPPGPGPSFPGITISTPNIPRLASGGVTTGATLAVVGDNPGGREAIIPLDRYDLSGASKLVPLLEQLIALTQAQAMAGGEQVDRLYALEGELRGMRTEAKRAPSEYAREMTVAYRKGAMR